MIWNTGVKVIWGIPSKILPVTNVPFNFISMKLRFRNKSEGKAYFLTEEGVRAFVLQDVGDHWEPWIEMERNVRKEGNTCHQKA